MNSPTKSPLSRSVDSWIGNQSGPSSCHLRISPHGRQYSIPPSFGLLPARPALMRPVLLPPPPARLKPPPFPCRLSWRLCCCCCRFCCCGTHTGEFLRKKREARLRGKSALPVGVDAAVGLWRKMSQLGPQRRQERRPGTEARHETRKHARTENLAPRQHQKRSPPNPICLSRAAAHIVP